QNHDRVQIQAQFLQSGTERIGAGTLPNTEDRIGSPDLGTELRNRPREITSGHSALGEHPIDTLVLDNNGPRCRYCNQESQEVYNPRHANWNIIMLGRAALGQFTPSRKALDSLVVPRVRERSRLDARKGPLATELDDGLIEVPVA